MSIHCYQQAVQFTVNWTKSPYKALQFYVWSILRCTIYLWKVRVKICNLTQQKRSKLTSEVTTCQNDFKYLLDNIPTYPCAYWSHERVIHKFQLEARLGTPKKSSNDLRLEQPIMVKITLSRLLYFQEHEGVLSRRDLKSCWHVGELWPLAYFIGSDWIFSNLTFACEFSD